MMEVTDSVQGKYRVTRSEARRAQVGALLLGRDLGPSSVKIMAQETTSIGTGDAISILVGNLALLQHLGDVSGQGVTHIAEIKNRAAHTVRTGIAALGLDQI